MESFDLRQHVNNFFRDAVGKEFILRIRADVDERKDRDGVTSGGRSNRCNPLPD
jgi:hypothetical protein